MPRTPPFTEAQLREANATGECWADALRSLGYPIRGSNYAAVRRWVGIWGVSVDHFDPNAGRKRAGASRTKPLEDVLVAGSSYSTDALKRRLFATLLKERRCEMCGQGEEWNGLRMSLVLDHISGAHDDNRLENLRIVCANCAATLDTHCGRNIPRERKCASCGASFAPRHIRHRYCGQRCWGAAAGDRYRGHPHPDQRKVERPPCEQLLAEIDALGWSAVGRKYGVSGNAVRKWVRWYEAEREAGVGPRSAGPSEPAAGAAARETPVQSPELPAQSGEFSAECGESADRDGPLPPGRATIRP